MPGAVRGGALHRWLLAIVVLPFPTEMVGVF
jgi:hypothetical protein